MEIEELYNLLIEEHPEALECAMKAWKEDRPSDKQVFSVGILVLYCEVVLGIKPSTREIYEGVIEKHSKNIHMNAQL